MQNVILITIVVLLHNMDPISYTLKSGHATCQRWPFQLQFMN